MRTGPRYDAKCVEIYSSLGHVIPWVNEFRYLGVLLHHPGHLNAHWMSLNFFIELLIQSSEKSAEQRQKRLRCNWF